MFQAESNDRKKKGKQFCLKWFKTNIFYYRNELRKSKP